MLGDLFVLWERLCFIEHGFQAFEKQGMLLSKTISKKSVNYFLGIFMLIKPI